MSKFSKYRIYKTLLISLLLTLVSVKSAWAYADVVKLIDTDAHEGPVCVKFQNRLYFSTLPNFKKKIGTSIKYLDFSSNKIHYFIQNSNMSNSMWLANDGQSLLVAEQGTANHPGCISQINLLTKNRKVLVDNFHGFAFNSPNKVIQARSGIIYFSDPDYGYYQGFKPKPQLKNAIYAFNPKNKKIVEISGIFKMPHGLALSGDQKKLYIGDTAAINGRDPYDVHLTHDIYVAYLTDPYHIREIQHFAQISPGIPDGFITTQRGLYVAAGNGVQYYSYANKLIKLFPIEHGAVALTQCNNTLYVTANNAIYKIPIKN